jgi:hypothetical protein
MNARLVKAIKDKNIKVVNHEYDNENGTLYFDILGSSNKIYKVYIDDCYKCTCPDFEKRNVMCKHIMHLYIKIFRIIPDLENTSNTSNKLNTLNPIQKAMIIKSNNAFWSIHNTKTRTNKDDDCTICIEKLNTTNLYTCSTCKNSFHNECIKTLCNYNKHCPLCRSSITIIEYVEDYSIFSL